MKLRLGATVIELDNITYATKTDDNRVIIYFVGSDFLEVVCGRANFGKASFAGDADALLDKIENHEKP